MMKCLLPTTTGGGEVRTYDLLEGGQSLLPCIRGLGIDYRTSQGFPGFVEVLSPRLCASRRCSRLEVMPV